MTMLQTIAAFDRIGEENAFAVLARANALSAQGRDIVNLGIGQPDFRTPEHIVEAAVKALRDGHHGYTPAIGILPLREAIVRRTLATTGVEVSPDQVLVVPGGKVTMFAAILMFGEPDADILYPDPGFPIYRSMIEFTGARPVPVPIREENGFAFSAEETLALITPQTRLLIVNSPANPTGGVTPRAEVDKLVEGLAAWPQVAILSDEIYDGMTYDGEEHVSLLTYPEIRDRLILLNGFSKTWAMTGWRLGWSVWPEALYDKVRKLAVNCWSCVNAPAQLAGIAAIDGPQDAVDEHGGGVRPPAAGRDGSAQHVAGRVLHHPEGRLLRLPQRIEDRLAGEAARQRAARRGRRGADRRAGFRRQRRGLHPPLLRQFGGEHPQGRGAGGGFPRQAQRHRHGPPRRRLDSATSTINGGHRADTTPSRRPARKHSVHPSYVNLTEL